MVAIKAVTATNRKKCVAPRRAGEAVAIQMIPKICKRMKFNIINVLCFMF